MTVGERIKARRNELKMTMKNVTAASGVKSGSLSEMENDKYLPSAQNLLALSRALNCSVDWLLTGKEYRKSEGVPLICDGVPLTESESDLIAMYRLIPDADKQTVFDITKLKYEQTTGEKVSIYSTYSDTKEPEKNGPENGGKAVNGTD
jgi:transcriptional regulator with XRE-family HTH domain